MRITCVIGPFFPVPAVRGGAVERIFLALCEEFARLGHDVTILSRRYPGFPKNETINGVRHIRIRSSDPPVNRILYRLQDLKYALSAACALPLSDVTITHSASLPLFIPKRRAGKVVVSVARYPKAQMGFYWRADRLQGVSSHITAAIREQSPSVAGRAKTIPNCLSEAFCQAAALESSARKKQIIYVGRIAREKGIDLLVRGFKILKGNGADWTLKIVGPYEQSHGGDGVDLLRELQSIAGSDLADVQFTGPIYDERTLISLMRESEIFVYPSVGVQGEALPLAPLEAMASGCAVVVSDLDCFSDYLLHEQNGLRFNHRDATGLALAEALRVLIEEPNFRRSLAEGGIKTSYNYTPQKVAQLFLDDFDIMERL